MFRRKKLTLQQKAERLRAAYPEIAMRFDANETFYLAQQLEAVEAQMYDVKYALSKARTLLPVSNRTPAGAESIAYYQGDKAGAARIIANYADDLPTVRSIKRKFSQGVFTIATAYEYSWLDIERAAMEGGEPLDAQQSRDAMEIIERDIDDIAAFGDAGLSIQGFTGVTGSAVDGVSNGAWATAAFSDILKDMHDLTNAIVEDTKEREIPDTLVLPTAQFNLIHASAKLSAQDVSVASVFLRDSPYIKRIESWSKLKGAGAAAADRMIAYRRDPSVVELQMPLEPMSLPPQARNLAWLTPVVARCAGITVRYPRAIRYMDGL